MGSKTTITVTSALKNKLKKTALETRKHLAHDLTDELVKAADTSMDTFYSHYEPARYKRTFGFRNKSFKSAYKNPHNTKITGGVRLTTSGIKTEYKTFTENGTKPDGEKAYTSIPIKKTDEKSNYLTVENGMPKTMGDILDLVYSGHHGYTTTFDIIQPKKKHRHPPVMDPSPRELIEDKRDEFLEQIKVEGYLNDIALQYWK